MKMLAECLDNALRFERLASEESEPQLRAEFEKQAVAYRKMATKRAQQLGLPLPPQK